MTSTADSLGRAPAPLCSDVYRDQSASDLRLNLLRGDVDLEQFTLLRVALMRRPRVRIDACIIGASHLLRVELPGPVRFHEVLACADVEAGSSRVFHAPVGELPGSVELDIGGGASYRFRPWLATSSQGQSRLRALEERIRRVRHASPAGGELGLWLEFPDSPSTRAAGSWQPDRGDEAPRTLLWLGVDSRDGKVRVETAHSYPNEGRVVFSETQLSLEPEREGAGR